jgi:hypothetical protein
MEAFIVAGIIYVLPQGKSLNYLEKVDGFSRQPGGIISSQRLTPGNELDTITLTTADDPVLNQELGLSTVIIDRVMYTATDPHEAVVID